MDDWEPLYVAVQEENRENGTDHQLPCARWQKEECGGRLITGAPMGKEHADDANGGQRRERPPPAKSPWQHQEQGKQQVVLFLYRQAPSMKQRLQLGCLCEVAALSLKKEIGDRKSTRLNSSH